MMMDTPIIKLDSSDSLPIDYKSAEVNFSAEPIWSDGRMDGTFIPKMIGTIRNPPHGKITLQDGSIITFTDFTIDDEGSIIIHPPYFRDNIIMA